MLCLCHYGSALLGLWFQTVLGSENSASFFKSTGGEDLGRDPFNQNSDRSDRENRTTSKRWTSFFETFPVGPNRSIEFWTKISGNLVEWIAPLSYHGHAWSHSKSNFYTLIGQNLTGEFMRTNYAASWKLFTLTAEADRVLCQLVMFLTVFFLWMYKMKYSCYQESSVIHGWFVYWVFGWEMRRLLKFGNSLLDGIVFVFHLA